MRRASEPNRYTTDAIKDLIRSRELLPGDLIPTEAELVAELGVSRSSVREAVRTLVALDILEVRHGTGTFVGDLSLQPLVEGMVFRGVLLPGERFQGLREIIEVRAGLDEALAPRVVDLMTHADISEICDDVAAIVDCAKRGRSFTEHDRRFHLNISALVGNQLYSQLVAAFWDIHTTLGPQLGVPSARALQDSADAHVALLETARSGDLTGYRAAIGAHYDPLLHILDSLETTDRKDAH